MMMFGMQFPPRQNPWPELHDPVRLVLVHRLVNESQASLVHSLLSLHWLLSSQNR